MMQPTMTSTALARFDQYHIQCDIYNADVQISKAAMLGILLVKFQEGVSPHAWRWAAFLTATEVLAYADYPGRCAALGIERFMELQDEQARSDRV